MGMVGYILHVMKLCLFVGLDKSGYQVNIFLISPRKDTLWVLIRSALARLLEYPQHTLYAFLER